MSMIYLISVIHALTCIFIVLFILLQDPKGGVLGSLGGGGGSKSFFGSDASPFLVNSTKWLAIIFACSSFYLSYMSSKTGSVMEKAGIEQDFSQPAGNPTDQQENDATTNENSTKQKNSNPVEKDQSSNNTENTNYTDPV